jgi:hypothetical protein
MIIFDTTKIEESEIREKINHNMFVVTSILLMKNIFRDINEWKPVVKSIIEADEFQRFIKKQQNSL